MTLPTLTTEGLVLDPFHETDRDDLAALNTDIDVTRPLFGVRTLEETHAELGPSRVIAEEARDAQAEFVRAVLKEADQVRVATSHAYRSAKTGVMVGSKPQTL